MPSALRDGSAYASAVASQALRSTDKRPKRLTAMQARAVSWNSEMNSACTFFGNRPPSREAIVDELVQAILDRLRLAEPRHAEPGAVAS